jgi:hypothetical protein
MPYIARLFEISLNIYNLAGILWIIIMTASLMYIYFFSKPSSGNMADELPAVSVLLPDAQPWYLQIRFWAVIMVICYACVYILFW